MFKQGRVFTPRRDHITTLDGLRAVAVLLVFWAHVPLAVLPQPIARFAYVLQPGYLGVDLFFVLSGFLITRILLVDQSAGRPLRQFLIKRCLRIFPIYFLVVGFSSVVAYGPYIKWCAVYLSNYYFALAIPLPSTPLNHTWSLAVEEHYYLVWPVLVYCCPPRVVRHLAVWVIPLLAIAAAVVTVYWLMEPKRAIEMVFRGTQYRMLSLALGGAVACYEPLVRGNTRRTFLVGVGILAVGAALFVGVGSFDKTLHIVTKQVAFGLVSLGVLLNALALADTPLHSLLDNPVMTYIGRISYGLYLYHYVAFYFLGALQDVAAGRTEPTLGRVAIAIAVSFTVAAASYAVLERPILRYKDRLFQR